MLNWLKSNAVTEKERLEKIAEVLSEDRFVFYRYSSSWRNCEICDKVLHRSQPLRFFEKYGSLDICPMCSNRISQFMGNGMAWGINTEKELGKKVEKVKPEIKKKLSTEGEILSELIKD